MAGESKVILVSSLVSQRDQKPRVDITVGQIRVQLSTHEARSLCDNIIQAIAAAESDAFIYNFLKHELKQKEEIALSIIPLFRDYRDKLEKEWLDS